MNTQRLKDLRKDKHHMAQAENDAPFETNHSMICNAVLAHHINMPIWTARKKPPPPKRVRPYSCVCREHTATISGGVAMLLPCADDAELSA